MSIKFSIILEKLVMAFRKKIIFTKISYLSGFFFSGILIAVFGRDLYFYFKLLGYVSVIIAALLFVLTLLLSRWGLGEDSVIYHANLNNGIGVFYLLIYVLLISLFVWLIFSAGVFSAVLLLMLLIW